MKYLWKKKKSHDTDVIWTRNLLNWSQTRYRCATRPCWICYLLRLCIGMHACLVLFSKYYYNLSARRYAFVAQGLEHWSCKPGVESSNLSEGFWLFLEYILEYISITSQVDLLCELSVPCHHPRICLSIKSAPNVGLEPTTLRLRVSCSTDWASRAVSMHARNAICLQLTSKTFFWIDFM